MSSVIYEPRGAAREYSPLACNLYLSCTHRCKYCYAPSAIQRRADDYFLDKPTPRCDILKKLESDLKKQVFDKQILLSFIGDVYCEAADDNAVTRGALELFLAYDAPVAILTKGGERCLKDLDLFQKFGTKIKVGATLTFLDADKSDEWEAGAASPIERLQTLKTLKEHDVKTFASFEPVLEPEESLAILEASLMIGCVDMYKIGKLNNYKGLDKQYDWEDFLVRALALVRPYGKELYIKKALRDAAPDVGLLPEEVDADLYAVRG